MSNEKNHRERAASNYLDVLVVYLKRNVVQIMVMSSLCTAFYLIPQSVMAQSKVVYEDPMVKTGIGASEKEKRAVKEIADTPIPEKAIPGRLAQKFLQKQWKVWIKPGFRDNSSPINKSIYPDAPYKTNWTFGYGIDMLDNETIMLISGMLIYGERVHSIGTIFSVKTIEEKVFTEDWKYGVKAGARGLYLVCEDCKYQIRGRFGESDGASRTWKIILAETPNGWRGELVDKSPRNTTRYNPPGRYNPLAGRMEPGSNMTHAVELEEKPKEGEPRNGGPIWDGLGDDSSSNPNDSLDGYPGNCFGAPPDRGPYNPEARESVGGYGDVFWTIFFVLLAVGICYFLYKKMANRGNAN